MDPIIAIIAQREGFTMVFDKGNAGLVYAPPSLDVTNELVRLYNDKYKGGVAGRPVGPTKKDDVAKPDAPKSDAPKQ